jgi:anti-anti-sigma factor
LTVFINGMLINLVVQSRRFNHIVIGSQTLAGDQTLVIMQVKIDTKEKFHVITLPGPTISAIMTEELSECLMPWLQNDVKNVILKLKEVQAVDLAAGETLVRIQQKFYENNASFVICEMQKPVDEFLDKNELLEMMNVTPTESEAWDIVQMEEIEREFLREDE